MISIVTGSLALALLQQPQIAPQPQVMVQQPQFDTTITVKPNVRLDVRNFGGSIIVHGWAKNAIRVTAAHSRRDRVEVDANEDVVEVGAKGRVGPSGAVDFEISVPVATALNLNGTYTDISIDGVRAKVYANTIKGDVVLKGGDGNITLKSVEGRVEVSQARGRMELKGVNEGIRASDVAGDVTAETINGDIIIERADASSVDAGTLNGKVIYDGAVRSGGTYTLASHDGDIWIGLPDTPSAAISVSSFEGHFQSSFPVQVPTVEGTRHRRRFTVTLGTGAARVELESFSGNILVRKRSELEAMLTRKRDE